MRKYFVLVPRVNKPHIYRWCGLWHVSPVTRYQRPRDYSLAVVAIGKANRSTLWVPS